MIFRNSSPVQSYNAAKSQFRSKMAIFDHLGHLHLKSPAGPEFWLTHGHYVDILYLLNYCQIFDQSLRFVSATNCLQQGSVAGPLQANRAAYVPANFHSNFERARIVPTFSQIIFHSRPHSKVESYVRSMDI